MVSKSTSASVLRAVICLAVLSAVSVFPSGPARGAAQTGRVDKALAALEKARTLPEISRVLENAKLTDQELRLLGERIQKRPLHKRIEGLRTQALANSKLSKAKTGPSSEQLFGQKRLALQKTRADSLTKSKQAVMKLKPARTTSATAATTLQPSTTLSVEKLALLTSTLGGGSNARINDCSAPVVGEEITIRGTGFGNTEGQVALIIRRDLYYFPVSRWTDTRIVCSVTDELGTVVRDALDGVPALLWVKLHGGETGPTLDTRILPNPESITPVIDSITPEEISPGQTFIIRGRNLVKYRYDLARVEILFGGGRSVQAVIEDPQHEFIQARIPDDFGGIQRTVCRLQVTNDLRRSAEQTVTFVPAEEMLSIRTPGRIIAASQPAFPIFLSVIGDTNRATVHDYVLQNGWVVEDCVLDVEAHGINAGAYYVEEPDRGSTRARAVIEAWADAYSRVTAVDTLIIKGPRGVPYR